MPGLCFVSSVGYTPAQYAEFNHCHAFCIKIAGSFISLMHCTPDEGHEVMPLVIIPIVRFDYALITTWCVIRTRNAPRTEFYCYGEFSTKFFFKTNSSAVSLIRSVCNFYSCKSHSANKHANVAWLDCSVHVHTPVSFNFPQRTIKSMPSNNKPSFDWTQL
jgi:hypothetical protein